MPLLATALLAVLILMSALWCVSLWKNDVSLVDRFWGLGFVLLQLVYAMFQPTPRAWLVLALVAVWGLRLSWHIHRRNRGKGEDYRYGEMRQRRGPAFRYTSLFLVFWLQAALAWIIALPLSLTALHPSAWSLWDAVGLSLWVVGFLFEAVGDAQLRRFKRDASNRGRVMDQGLWRYTRHPNYFGDACLWFGFFFFAVASAPGLAWFFLPCPFLMLFLLVRVSGVSLLEKTMRSRPGYAQYQARTSAFFPWPPRGDR